MVAIIGGPRSADGYTWYQVVGPLREWGLVRPLDGSGWVAASGAGTTRLSPVKAPNTTRIAAALGHVGFGNAGSGQPRQRRGRDRPPRLLAERRPFGRHDPDRLDERSRLRQPGSPRLEGGRDLVGNVPIEQARGRSPPVRLERPGRHTTLPNGKYLVSLVGRDAGTTFYDPSPVFRAGTLATYGVTIDTVFPVVAAASSGSDLISPNGDGIRDAVTLKLTAKGATAWAFSAAPLSGSTIGAAVATRSGYGGTAAVSWNGRSTAGAVVRDGLYRLTLSAADNAGDRVARAWTVRVDDTPAALAASAAPVSFSPNGDGAGDSSRLGWSASERITGSARVYRGTTLIRSWTVAAATAGAVRWTGTDAAGRAVPDGRYLSGSRVATRQATSRRR